MNMFDLFTFCKTQNLESKTHKKTVTLATMMIFLIVINWISIENNKTKKSLSVKSVLTHLVCTFLSVLGK